MRDAPRLPKRTAVAFGRLGGRRPALAASVAPVRPCPQRAPAGASVAVGVGDVQVALRDQRLVTYGLGSCIAICAYEPHLAVAGMLHFMLPTSAEGSADARRTRPAVFADTGWVMLLDALRAVGAAPRGLRVKLVGGASVSAVGSDIGARNALAARRLLWKARVRVDAEDVGGACARTVRFATDGRCTVHSPGKEDVSI